MSTLEGSNERLGNTRADGGGYRRRVRLSEGEMMVRRTYFLRRWGDYGWKLKDILGIGYFSKYEGEGNPRTTRIGVENQASANWFTRSLRRVK